MPHLRHLATTMHQQWLQQWMLEPAQCLPGRSSRCYSSTPTGLLSRWLLRSRSQAQARLPGHRNRTPLKGKPTFRLAPLPDRSRGDVAARACSNRHGTVMSVPPLGCSIRWIPPCKAPRPVVRARRPIMDVSIRCPPSSPACMPCAARGCSSPRRRWRCPAAITAARILRVGSDFSACGAIHGPRRLAACGGEAKVRLACRAAAVRAAVFRFGANLRLLER